MHKVKVKGFKNNEEHIVKRMICKAQMMQLN